MDNDRGEFCCPVCNEVPPAEIFQCRNGHSVCRTCFASLLNCPLCRDRYGTDRIRNRAMEEMLWRTRNPSPSAPLTTSYSLTPETPNPEKVEKAKKPGLSSWLMDQFSKCQDDNGSLEATPNERLLISGSKPVVVTGDGGFLEITGSANVQFIGSPQSVTHSGSGTVIIEGDIQGSLIKSGSGSIFIRGNITGNLVNSGSGMFSVQGNVTGNIQTGGSSTLSVQGNVSGNLVKKGSGVVTVCGSLKGNLVNKGKGTVSIQGCN